jgi:signal transduction histidine kinase
MKNRSWPLLAVAFGALILVIGLSGAALYRHLEIIYTEVSVIQGGYRESERLLNELSAEMYSSAILVRDYLLDFSVAATVEQRQRLLALRATTSKHLDELDRLLGPQQSASVARLRQNSDQYWELISESLAWTPAQKAARSSGFLRRHIMPYRSAILSLAQDVGALNVSDLNQRHANIQKALHDIRGYLTGVMAGTIALGLLIGAVSIARMTVLENRAEHHRALIEHDRQEMRSLSQKLVKAQEAERKSISRELHDQVGQMLTALRMEIGNVEQLRHTPGGEFQEHVTAAKELAEQTLRTVRDLAMGLRPSMLDDLGLASALKWQAREFTRYAGVPVDVQIEGSLDQLSEDHRTCIYRIVQEALTNCARHAAAQSIRISLRGDNDVLALAVQDDGVGFTPAPDEEPGLGLLGIEERVRELGGKMSIESQAEKGTLLKVEIPAGREVPA